MKKEQVVMVKVFTTNESRTSGLGANKVTRRRVPKLSQVYDHKPVILSQNKVLNLACCDCGLTHKLKVTGPVRGKYRLTFLRDDAMTKRVRMAKPFPMFLLASR
jgi:hypothetical protein